MKPESGTTLDLSDAISPEKVLKAMYQVQRDKKRGSLISEIEEVLTGSPSRDDLSARRALLGVLWNLVTSGAIRVEDESVYNGARSCTLHFYRLTQVALGAIETFNTQEADTALQEQ
jgi:hypothetical protein